MSDLTAEKDIRLINNVKNKTCNDSLVELSNRYSAVCFDICKKYAPAISSSGSDINDITDQRFFFVYKACLSFNPSKKVKFSTWLGNFTKYQCLNIINQKKTLNYILYSGLVFFLLNSLLYIYFFFSYFFFLF